MQGTNRKSRNWGKRSGTFPQGGNRKKGKAQPGKELSAKRETLKQERGKRRYLTKNEKREDSSTLICEGKGRPLRREKKRKN